MTHSFIIAGFGGQGVMLMGQILAQAAMIEGKNVTWFPSYGPEMRGGTANCTVVISDEPVASPVVENPLELVVMNIPSLLKFEPKVKPSGYLFVNSSVVDRKPTRNDIQVFEIPVNDLAEKLGNARVANMVMLGAVVQVTKCVKLDAVVEAIKYKLSSRGEQIVDLNIKAIYEGVRHVGGSDR
ncbi:2-oxoacid:acceptor oxidoreductase family protein [Pseudothermotoga thermarum]|uniref:Pyruvate/ketoisovalerate oxidoreductase, gamma subunit n=1 Tax=Pseudothermotoga thermarum DSM 5069 TaxID=688269 RepID=F7YWB1_9THEM|nr:2-oxoacid:acceptor oxidoreductase family protein [Pseudothermotoga thermarum]AEH51886.1 pyruvate/ketoisovalerate oxidoreductase, gamma subunit [Pseudothermotoga thermarum DSM 5069]